MPFGVSWSYYLKMWGVSLFGFALGSQLIHSQYQPLENFDIIVQQEVEKLREKYSLKKPTSEEKLKKVLEQDKEYMKLFKVESSPSESTN